jgi:hypothetical protein
MKKLRSDWLTAHWEEEELPRYEFLDYLQGLHHEMSAAGCFLSGKTVMPYMPG